MKLNYVSGIGRDELDGMSHRLKRYDYELTYRSRGLEDQWDKLTHVNKQVLSYDSGEYLVNSDEDEDHEA